MAKTKDQYRADHAWAVIDQIAVQNKDMDVEYRKRFGAEVKKYPARIKKSGLGHAHAFLLAKSVKERNDDGQLVVNAHRANGDLARFVSDWVCRQSGIIGQATNQPSFQEHFRQANNRPANNSKDELLLKVNKSDAQTLQRMTAEALAYLQWLGCAAEARGFKHEGDE